MLASALIDTSALWKIVAVGFAGGAGVVVAFGFVVLGTSRFAEARQGGVAARGGYALLVLVGAGVLHRRRRPRFLGDDQEIGRCDLGGVSACRRWRETTGLRRPPRAAGRVSVVR
jgi:hypothetical protein